jgi:putative membrane protein
LAGGGLEEDGAGADGRRVRAAAFRAVVDHSVAEDLPGAGDMSTRNINDFDRTRIIEAIRAAEAHTAGEIYVVIAREADDFRFIPVLWAALVALLVPWPLHLLTYWSAGSILLTQMAAFVVIALALSHPEIRHWVVPPSIAAEAARKSAQAQFLSHGIHLTEERTGVLIYVAIVDRRIEIVADAGINSKVDQSSWNELTRKLIVAARRGALPDGLIEVIGRTGELLAEHWPPRPSNPNELPDRVVEI